MKVIIVGAGKIGKAIIISMLKEKHDVTVIDSNKTVIENVTDTFDVIGMCGDGASFDILKDAGAAEADLFIAVTSLDELNMLSCFIAKKMGAAHTVARTRDYEFNSKGFEYIKDQLELSLTINPELLTAQTVFNIIKLPSATKVETFSNRLFEMAELILKADSPLINVPLCELRKKYPLDFLICAVLRGEEVFIPNGSFVFREGDKIGVIASITESHKLLKMMNFLKRPIRDVIIVGGGKTAFYLSELLISSKTPVRIIEKNRQKCEEMCAILPSGATIIEGDGMSHELLTENGVLTTDAFVSLTGKDEENILMSMYAADKGVGKVLTKINRDELCDMAEKAGLETIITPKEIVADVLVRYARSLQGAKGTKIENLYSLMNGKAEAAEFGVMSDFKYIGVPLKKLQFTPATIIAGLIRDGKTIIPGGEDKIAAGDKVIVITAGQSLYDLSDVIVRQQS